MTCPVLSNKQYINVVPSENAFLLIFTKLQIAIITVDRTNKFWVPWNIVQTMNSTDSLHGGRRINKRRQKAIAHYDMFKVLPESPCTGLKIDYNNVTILQNQYLVPMLFYESKWHTPSLCWSSNIV